MPRGRPRKSQASPNGGISKMEAVRRALRALGGDPKPLEIQEYIKKTFGITIDTLMISSYKSNLKSAGKSTVIRRPAGRAPTARGGQFSLGDIEAVKAVADRIGADKLKQLADVLSK